MYRLRKPIHSPWLIALASVALVGGVALAGLGELAWLGSFGWLMSGLALVLFGILRQRLWAVSFVLLGGLLMGLSRGAATIGSLAQYDGYFEQTVTIAATIADDTDTDAHGNVVLRLRDVRIEDRPMPGLVWVSLNRESSSLQRSDNVRVTGKLAEGFGGFAGSMFEAELRSSSRPEPGDIALKIRDSFSHAVRAVIPEPQASLGVGYLLGQRRALPPELDTALQITGLTHVVVARL